MKKSLLWFRRDLRLSNNIAVTEAFKSQLTVPIYIHDESTLPIGEASKSWLHHSLKSLQQELQEKGLDLFFYCGDPKKIILSLVKEHEIKDVFWNRRYEKPIVDRDIIIKKKLKECKVEVHSFKGSFLLEPWENCKKDKTPYLVFTPYYNALRKKNILPKEMSPKKFPKLLSPKSQKLNQLSLKPKIRWDKDFYRHWNPGEKGAKRNLSVFLKKNIETYESMRNIPSTIGTSRLSPHLHFGEISPHLIWEQTLKTMEKKNLVNDQFLKEIIWREFAQHLLFYYPESQKKPLKVKYAKFPWRQNNKRLAAWKRGNTGIPIVDAGMRELWNTGWMHNRVRMIVGSFLVKNLLIPWQQGEKWFYDTLLDADPANNGLGWQWIAGCGADAAPFFRVFNPVLQGEKFDKEGQYIKKWIPQLQKVENKYIHKPWELPPLEKPKDYPDPIVDLKQSRNEALEAFQKMKYLNERVF